jgi:hypothetical protein
MNVRQENKMAQLLICPLIVFLTHLLFLFLHVFASDIVTLNDTSATIKGIRELEIVVDSDAEFAVGVIQLTGLFSE